MLDVGNVRVCAFINENDNMAPTSHPMMDVYACMENTAQLYNFSQWLIHIMSSTTFEPESAVSLRRINSKSCEYLYARSWRACLHACMHTYLHACNMLIAISRLLLNVPDR